MKVTDSEATNSQRLNVAMAVRRGFLILAAPLVLFSTIAAIAQWRAIWQWLIK